VLLTRIQALRETRGLQATRETKATLAEAEAWLEMSGAKSYQPFLHVERAELARLVDGEATSERELRDARRWSRRRSSRGTRLAFEADDSLHERARGS
jgi:hypothetical protein